MRDVGGSRATVRIPLYGGQIEEATSVVIDGDNYHWARSYRWRVRRRKKPYRVISKHPRTGKNVSLARMVTNASADEFVQFLDGNGLNCTRANLALVARRSEAAQMPMKGSNQRPTGLSAHQLRWINTMAAPPIMQWALWDDLKDTPLSHL